MSYRVFLALHLVSVISWMAGILYLIRLFVYHSAETEAVVVERFKVMEYRLYRYITYPAMLASFLFGGVMLYLQPFLLSQSWMQVKLFCVFLMAAATEFSGKQVKSFAEDQNTFSEKFYRVFNEIPTLLMIAIVFLVILKVALY